MLTNATTVKSLTDALATIRGKWSPANGGPADFDAANPRATPRGGTIRLAPGVYAITEPLTLWAATTLVGNGPDTVIDARGIPANRAAVELAGTPVGPDAWCGGARVERLTIRSAGAGVGLCPAPAGKPTPDHPARPTIVGGLRLADLDLFCDGGYGVDLSAGYAQACVIEDCCQSGPGSGGLAIRGNKNTVRRYALVNGYSGGGFRSPWLDGRGQVDVGGHGNLVEQCHVEHGVPLRADGSVDPVNAVVPFRFWSTEPGAWQDVMVNGNWAEFHQPGALATGYSLRFEWMRARGFYEWPGMDAETLVTVDGAWVETKQPKGDS